MRYGKLCSKSGFGVSLLIMSAMLTGADQHAPIRDRITVESLSPAVANGRLVQSIGLQTLGGVFTPLLSAGMRVPCNITQVFSTAVDNQDQITLFLYRGTSRMCTENKLLGAYRMQRLEPMPKGSPKINLDLSVVGQEISILAVETATGRKISISKVAQTPPVTN